MKKENKIQNVIECFKEIKGHECTKSTIIKAFSKRKLANSEESGKNEVVLLLYIRIIVNLQIIISGSQKFQEKKEESNRAKV